MPLVFLYPNPDPNWSRKLSRDHVNLTRDHPFKTSAFSRGGGVSPLPTFADSRGVGVLGMPMSAIF